MYSSYKDWEHSQNFLTNIGNVPKIKNRGDKMAKFSKSDVRDLVSLVGGKDNVAAVTHCVTRMRFVLKDESLANVPKIGELSAVKGTFTSGGQFQVIIGPSVGDFYKEFIEEAGLGSMSKDEAKVAARQRQGEL